MTMTDKFSAFAEREGIDTRNYQSGDEIPRFVRIDPKNRKAVSAGDIAADLNVEVEQVKGIPYFFKLLGNNVKLSNSNL